MKIDLHIHSNNSDGTNTPEEIVKMAKQIRLQTISITDHNTYKGSEEALQTKEQGIEIIPGIEISAHDSCLPKSARLHILGYNITFNNQNLQKFVEREHQNARETLLIYLELLKKHYNILFPQEDIEKILARKGDINRNDIAKLLIKHGYCNTMNECFDRYLTPIYTLGKKPEKISEEGAIHLIKNAGGIISLAHPTSLKLNYQDLKEYILYLKHLGLDAIEIEHIHVPPTLKPLLYELCQKENLAYSGGTDYHGENKPNVHLGSGGTDNKNYPINIDELSILKLIKKNANC